MDAFPPEWAAKLLDHSIAGFALILMIILHWVAIRDIQSRMSQLTKAIYRLPILFYQVFKHDGQTIFESLDESSDKH